MGSHRTAKRGGGREWRVEIGGEDLEGDSLGSDKGLSL